MKRLEILVVLALASGCRTQPLDLNGVQDQPADLAPSIDLARAPTIDFSFPTPPDLSIPMTNLHCSELVQCILGCQGQGCQQMCFQNATQSGRQLFLNAFNCGFMTCISTMRCQSAMDNSQKCTTCLNNALGGLLAGGGGCQPSNDPVCDACAQEAKTCAADQ
jgi:hypothetical protein